MPSIGHDTKFLQELVGDALARGVASTISSQPNDPVDYLGQWLLRYVKNAREEGTFVETRAKEVQGKIVALETEQKAADASKAAAAARKAEIDALAAMDAEPTALVARALELIKANTSAGAVYAATVAEPEEPDWSPPEDPEDPEANESDDEVDPPAPAGEGEEGEEGEAAAVDAPAEEEPASSEEPDAPRVPRPVDYSRKYLSYTAASPGQEFMVKAELRRPGPPPEDAGEDYVPEPTPFTFRILDEPQPMVYCANVAFEASIKFLREFPKIGSYQACGIKSGEEYKAVVAVDTLFPEGSGQPLSQADTDYVWGVCLALSKAYEAQEARFAASREGNSAADAVAKLAADIVAIYHPPAPEPVEGEEGAAAEPAAVEPAPEEASDEEAPADAAAADGEEGGEPVDPIVALTAELKTLRSEVKAATEAKAASAKALDLAAGAMHAVVSTLSSLSEPALVGLRNATAVPQGTFHAVKAVLHLLGKAPDSLSNWKRAFEHFTPALFVELAQFDPMPDRDSAVWKLVRSAYKAAPESSKLAAEMPDTHLGPLLLMYVRWARKVGRKAAVLRSDGQMLSELSATVEAKEVELAELEAAKAAEETRVREEAAAVKLQAAGRGMRDRKRVAAMKAANAAAPAAEGGREEAASAEGEEAAPAESEAE
ncbi:hypothetical protein FOA52_016001 [Chlamydomonas sp. UWO 241]|nr:hypothetical protein FOA52_016001 [Chlamydomonas sp. UWO 241]